MIRQSIDGPNMKYTGAHSRLPVILVLLSGMPKMI